MSGSMSESTLVKVSSRLIFKIKLEWPPQLISGMSLHSLISRQVTDTEKSTLYSQQQGDGSFCMNSDTILK